MTPTDPVEAVARVIDEEIDRDDTTLCGYRIYDLSRAAIRAYREALEASGWQVVPKEPVAGMVMAGAYKRDAKAVEPLDKAEATYRAMLQAAPTPEDRDDDPT